MRLGLIGGIDCSEQNSRKHFSQFSSFSSFVKFFLISIAQYLPLTTYLALKLEQNLENRLELIEEYYTEKEEARVQDKSFEARMKRMARGGGPGGPR